jgi:hypothetical protein
MEPQTETIVTPTVKPVGRPFQTGHKGGPGRPKQPDAPTTACETRALLAAEVVKKEPSATRVRGLQSLLDSLAQQETPDASELQRLRESHKALQVRVEEMTHDAAEFDALRAERDALRRGLESTTRNLTLANQTMKEAVSASAIAVSAQQQAESRAATYKQQLDSSFMKLIEPLVNVLKRLAPAGQGSVEAREYRHIFETLLAEFRRMHAESLRPSVTPAPVASVKMRATPAEWEKAIAAQTEADRIENLKQPRSIEPTAYESMRERAVPRAPEPEPHRPISGGIEFEPWV